MKKYKITILLILILTTLILGGCSSKGNGKDEPIVFKDKQF